MLRAFATLIQSALDVILPRKERVVRIDHYRMEDIPIAPHEYEARGIQIVTLMQYRNQVVDDLIRALKYNRAENAALLLAGALAEYLRDDIAERKAFSSREIVLVPVPLHAARQRERGFNQVAKILSSLPEEFHNGTLSRVVSDALVRTRNTPQQTRLSRSERLKNVEGAFALTAADGIRGRHIILVDDVTTTGATLTEAATPFAGESITLLALAHA